MITFLFTAFRMAWNSALSFLVFLSYIMVGFYIYFISAFFKVLLVSSNLFGHMGNYPASAAKTPINLRESFSALLEEHFSTLAVGGGLRISVPVFIASSFTNLIIIFSACFIIYIAITFLPFFKHIKLRNTGARPITDREYAAIKGAFEDVNRKYFGKKSNPGRIKFYVYDSNSINAYALANSHVCIYKGILGLEDYVLKGLLSHEIAHIKLGHSIGMYLNTMSCYFLDHMLLPFELLVKLFRRINMDWLLRIVYIVVGVLLFLPDRLLRMAEFCVLRTYENQADDYSIKNGYGKGLYRALEKLEPNQKPLTIIETFYLSHPHLAFRLDRVSKKLNKVSMLFN